MLHLQTIIDGEERQSESVSDLLFDCATIISYLSTGTTLQKGSVIMTGTPGGKPQICVDSAAPCSNSLPRSRLWNESAEIFAAR